ncbi:MAG: regulatory protein GemA [Desulfobacterales bacterium]|jgi:phage gp16-like protein|nr:regulatory protein GemA [Desulfobacterales bacterium]
MKSEEAKKTDPRRRELALIHIGKKQLGFDDKFYRKIIKDVGQAESGSARDLDEAGRKAVLIHLKRMGVSFVHKSARASGMHIKPSEDRAPQLSKIGAILADLKYPWAYADGMARNMFGVKKVRWLKPDQLQKLIVALIYHQKRRRCA